jgi:sporulation protein YlmC with PRC-barrel domain
MRNVTIKSLRGDEIVALDGRVGSLDDLYIDRERWAVRYLVVDTGSWLHGRRVLLPPELVVPGGPDGDAIFVALTREEVHNRPGVEADPPASDLFEQARANQYGNRSYWEGYVPLNATPAQYAAPLGGAHPDADAERKAIQAERAARRTRLCSGSELLGYSVVASDGAYGHIRDFVVDERDWTISGVVVDTRGWLTGKNVLVPPRAIGQIDWEHRFVRMRLTQEEIERSPAAA